MADYCGDVICHALPRVIFSPEQKKAADERLTKLKKEQRKQFNNLSLRKKVALRRYQKSLPFQLLK